MKDFKGKLAVVTGGGSGMGREIVRQLVAEGAHVALCDMSAEAMAETVTLANAGNRSRVTTHLCDVSNEADMMRFRDEVLAQHQQDHVDLLFNNAGIGGGGSFVAGDRAEWERTFSVCWQGVYLGCRKGSRKNNISVIKVGKDMFSECLCNLHGEKRSKLLEHWATQAIKINRQLDDLVDVLLHVTV